jgi:hypothetical protein
VPTTAQDRISRGPLGALLILLSLLLTTGAAAAAGNDLREPLARLGPSRSGAATALLPSGTRNPLDDDAIGADGAAAIPPSAPGPVTEVLWTRPGADAPSGGRVSASPPATASYRARAPPAS